MSQEVPARPVGKDKLLKEKRKKWIAKEPWKSLLFWEVGWR